MAFGRTVFVALLALAASALIQPAFADGPKVVSATPANGAADVSTSVGEITVEFDRPMKTDAYSVMIVDQGEFPPLKPVTAPWASPTRFVLKLNMLKPGARYAFQLNGPNTVGFQSAGDGAPLPPTLFVFATRDDRVETRPPGQTPTLASLKR